MQIKYRIMLVYTITVTIILLFLCSSVYFFSAQNRTRQFRERLERKAISTASLLLTYRISPEAIKELNQNTPTSFLNKSIYVYGPRFQKIFSYYDTPEDSIYVAASVLSKAIDGRLHFFEVGNKDAIATLQRSNGTNYVIVCAAYDKDKADWMPKLRFILMLCFIISVSIAIVSGYVFSIGLVRSISILTGRVNRITSEEFSQRLDSGNGKDELQQLAITINRLLDRLQSSFNTQRRFIENASHELSTPLASIGSQIDVALQRERASEDYKKVLQSVNDDVKRLGSLVKSLLEIAKVSGSVKGIELSKLRIDELLMRMPSEMKKIEKDYEVKLVFDELPEQEEAMMVYGNEELLFSALKNIVHNACKFSTNNTAILKLSFGDNDLVINIQDHGPGISSHEVEQIFQPFYRSDTINNVINGTGLGLPLASQIISIYGGDIKVQSKLGAGSSFIITLQPLPAASI